LAGSPRPYSVRMITLHVNLRGWWSEPDIVEGEAYRLGEAVDRAVEENGLRPDSLRITLQPAPSLAEAAEAASELGAISESSGVYINAGYYPSAELGGSTALELAREGIYFSVLLETASWDRVLRIADIINTIAEDDPVNATRLAVNALGDPLETPYYPLSSTIPGRHPLISVGLTYPSHLAEAYRQGGVEALAEAAASAGAEAMGLARAVAQALGVPRVGVDLSAAPWMKESSLGLVELVAGVRLPEPGIALGLEKVNRALSAAAGVVGSSLGFNSVQLPVAEDLKLKARVSEGDTTARDLARLAGVCLAGLDMAAVPYDQRLVGGLILEVAAYARSKAKPLGVRLIALEGVEPGDRIALGRFGEVPVMPI
jgi:uncharacterized protein (UPF0210 family)